MTIQNLLIVIGGGIILFFVIFVVLMVKYLDDLDGEGDEWLIHDTEEEDDDAN